MTHQWKFFVNEIWEDAEYLPSSQFVEIQYRDLVALPNSVLKNIFEICGLKMSVRVEWYLEHVTLMNRNDKWRKALNIEQQQTLNDIITEEKFKGLLDDEL